MAMLNTTEIEKLIKGKKISGIIKAICGQKIGFGCYRDVYELKQNKDYVVKVEVDCTNGVFANVTEWRNWINNKDWKFLADFLAPCELITQDGRILIQRRVTFKSKELYPDRIPAMLTDIKTDNFGWIKNKFVCCDYAFIPFYIIKVGKNSMKKVKYWTD